MSKHDLVFVGLVRAEHYKFEWFCKGHFVFLFSQQLSLTVSMIKIIFIFIFQFQRSRFDGATMNFFSSLHQMVADASSSLQVNIKHCTMWLLNQTFHQNSCWSFFTSTYNQNPIKVNTALCGFPLYLNVYLLSKAKLVVAQSWKTDLTGAAAWSRRGGTRGAARTWTRWLRTH